MKDLTVGDTKRILWRFALPMLGSVAFQQMYNIADSVIAGRYAGKDALAAVGASYPVTMIFLAVAIGANVGSSVVISQLFGHKEYSKMKTAIYTALLAAVGLAVLLTMSGTLACTEIMRALHTPDSIFADAVTYLQIYIWGFVFLFIYNICTGVFTALGDSKTPLYLLISSSVCNVILDLIFVAVLKKGVAGVAWATFIAQGLASIISLFLLLKKVRCVKHEKKVKIFSMQMLLRISYIAIPSILQQSFVSVGNVLIQSLVNGFGAEVIAGYSAAVKLNTFAITSFTTIGNAVSSFTAQNIGARKFQRIKEGFKNGTFITLGLAFAFVLLYFVFGKFMVGLFVDKNTETAVISEGVRFLRIVSPFYFIICIKLLCDGILRGAAAVKCFMATTFLDLILRVIIAYILVKPFNSTGIWTSWPIGWIVSTFLSLYFYKKLYGNIGGIKDEKIN